MKNNTMIISIGRQCGSGGHEIGEKLARHYGISFYDRNIIALLAEKMDLDVEAVSRSEEKLNGFFVRRGGFGAKQQDLMNRLSATDRLYIQERSLILELAEKESFVIIGRGANDFLLDNPNTLRLFIYAPDSFRIPRFKEDYRIEYDSDARVKMVQIDKERRQYFEYYTGRTWGALDHHDLMLDSSLLGIDGTVDLIIDAADRKFKFRSSIS